MRTKLYIVTYKSEQMDTVIDSAFFDLDEAKGRVALLEETSTYEAHVGIVTREAVKPREWTEEQRRWMRGRS